jgi:hypothetical protein
MTEEKLNTIEFDRDKKLAELKSKNYSYDELLNRAIFFEELTMILLSKLIPEERDRAEILFKKTIQKTVFESMLEGVKFQKSAQGQKAANSRHKEHRAIKNDVINYYKANRENFPDKDNAAFYISEHIVPGTAFATIRKYLRNI